MRIELLTLFPEMFNSFLDSSIVNIALKKKAIEISTIDIRDFAFNKHRQVDDYPYGGGAGMIMKPEPIAEGIKFLDIGKNVPIIYFTPQGKLLNQKKVRQLMENDRIVIICGHYKEIDNRIRDKYVTEEISIGDYVLSSGELASMVLIDALSRLQEGVINDIESAESDSHEKNLLGCPYYTRPVNFDGISVPEILLSGNHAKIDIWRNEKSIEITKKIRPEFLNNEKE